jgi:hypothetical protein
MRVQASIEQQGEHLNCAAWAGHKPHHGHSQMGAVQLFAELRAQTFFFCLSVFWLFYIYRMFWAQFSPVSFGNRLNRLVLENSRGWPPCIFFIWASKWRLCHNTIILVDCFTYIACSGLNSHLFPLEMGSIHSSWRTPGDSPLVFWFEPLNDGYVTIQSFWLIVLHISRVPGSIFTCLLRK